LGSGGISTGSSFLGIVAFSVWGAGGTGGSDVSILRCLGFCPDNLRFRTEVASFAAYGAFGVVWEASFISDV